MGDFPVPEDGEAYQYDRNPNEISEQDYTLDLAKDPDEAASASCLSLGAIGVPLDGSYFFNALDAPDVMPVLTRYRTAVTVTPKCPVPTTTTRSATASKILKVMATPIWSVTR